MARKYFPFYFSFRDTAQMMKPKMRAIFYESIINYAATGEKPTLPDAISGYWPLVEPMLDAARSHYEAGEKGGRPSNSSRFGFGDSETNGFSDNKTTGSCKEKEKEKEKENQQRPTAPPAAVAPHKGALGGMTALGSSLEETRDAETEAARQRFLDSMKRPSWAAADAAPPDAEKEE